MCTVKGWNLGEQCLMDRKTKAAYREYYKKDETFRKEIEGKIGAEAVLDMADILEPDSEGEEPNDDDTDIPLSRIIRASLDLEVADHIRDEFCTSSDLVIEEADGSLHAGAVEENIWAFQHDG